MTNSVDEHVGSRIRSRRRILGMTQAELGGRIGLKHQAIHKFECGATRVSVEHLWNMAVALGAPINYFFEGLNARLPHEGRDWSPLIATSAR